MIHRRLFLHACICHLIHQTTVAVTPLSSVNLLLASQFSFWSDTDFFLFLCEDALDVSFSLSEWQCALDVCCGGCLNLKFLCSTHFQTRMFSVKHPCVCVCSCSEFTIKCQNHLALFLDIPPMSHARPSLQEALSHYMQPDVRELKCAKCSGQRSKVETVFTKLPRYYTQYFIVQEFCLVLI
jgi:hypothetical protein